MKKLFTLLLTISVVSSVIAQNFTHGHRSNTRQAQISAVKKLRLDSFLVQTWSETTGQLVNDSKIMFTYDANGNETQEVTYYWEPNSGEWLPDYKTDYDYNSSNQQIRETDSRWDENTNGWVYGRQNEYTYNSYGYNTVVISSDWLESSSKWDATDKYEKTYNTQGKLTTQLTYYFSNNAWTLAWKEEFTYDMNGFESMVVTYHYDQNNKWVISGKRKTDRTYDTYTNILSEVYSTWDIATLEWTYKYKSEFTYDLNVSGNDILWVFGDMCKNKLQSVTNYKEYVNNTWVKSEYITFSYSDLTTAIDDQSITHAAVSLFPNPAKNIISCSLAAQGNIARLIVYDAEGNSVINQQVENKAAVSVAHLQSGLYFYNLADTKTSVNGKLVIE